MAEPDPAEMYRRKVEECEQAAERASRAADKEAWLGMADQWRKLAESAE